MAFPRTGVLLAVLASGCGGTGPVRATPPAPNVLLITIGSLRADRLGCLGHGKRTSPALDAFAAGAVLFENAEASAPTTLPALASLMTGEAPSTHACEEPGSVLDGSFVTLAEHLLAAGYDTACVVSTVLAGSRHGLHQGLVHSDDSSAYPEIEPELNSSSQVISDKGIRFLDQKRAAGDGPWFLWLHYADPEAQYLDHRGLSEALATPGERDPGVVLCDAYDGEVAYTDQHVGRVLERLGENGSAAHTVVVVLADHGVELSDRAGVERGGALCPGLLRVPLLVRTPGGATRRVSDLVRQVDVLPTLLELTGATLPAGIPGRSLVPLLAGQTLERVPALAELHDGWRSEESLRLGRFRLVRRTRGASVALHDLESDPDETSDVAARYPEELAAQLHELERALAAARARRGAGAVPAAAARLGSHTASGQAEPQDANRGASSR